MILTPRQSAMLEAYDSYIEDCEWLRAKPDLVVIASDRMAIYYSYAEKLIKLGAAYVCTCSQEEFKRYKKQWPLAQIEIGLEKRI